MVSLQSKQVFNNVPEEHQIKNEPLHVFTKVNDRSDRNLRIRDIVDSNNLEDQGLQVKYPVCFECFDKIIENLDEKTKAKENKSKLYA